MDRLTGPGLAPLRLGAGPPPDAAAEPAGFVVASDDGTRIHFLAWGEGADAAADVGDGAADAGDGASATREGESPGRHAPGVLLLHGLASTAWSWAAVARRLRGDTHVVAVDLRGHGLSDAPTIGYEPETLAADVLAVAEGSGLLAPEGFPTRPFVLAGIGYGAIVAAWAAHALGERCAGLILVDGGWEDLAAATGAAPDEWLAEIEEPPEVLASMRAWLADREAFDPASWDVDEERAARAQVVETAAGRVKPAVHPHAMSGSVRAMWSYDPAAVLPAVEARIVALLARDEDGSRAAALAEVAGVRAKAGRSSIEATSFPGRGHNLVRHEPGAVAAAVLGVAAGATMRP